MKLYIPEYQKRDITEMQLSIMENELNQLNEKNPLKNEQVDFVKIYNIKTDEGAESYFYIRNNSSKNINLEYVPIQLKHEKRLVAVATPNFKQIGVIPSKTAVAFKAQFKMKDIFFPKYIAKSELIIEGEVTAIKTIHTSIENLPENIDYYQKEFLNNYVNSLKELPINSFDINVVSISEDEGKSLNISLLIRNGYIEHGIEIDTLPIKVFTKSGVLIYNGAFRSNDLKVSKASSKLFNIILPEENLLVKDGRDYSEFQVQIN